MSVSVAEKVFKVMGSRSQSDGHGNPINLIAPEPLKGFEQKNLQTVYRF